jgi:hypothetical protein
MSMRTPERQTVPETPSNWEQSSPFDKHDVHPLSWPQDSSPPKRRSLHQDFRTSDIESNDESNNDDDDESKDSIIESPIRIPAKSTKSSSVNVPEFDDESDIESLLPEHDLASLLPPQLSPESSSELTSKQTSKPTSKPKLKPKPVRPAAFTHPDSIELEPEPEQIAKPPSKRKVEMKDDSQTNDEDDSSSSKRQ